MGDFGRLSSRNGPALLPALPYPGASHPPPGLVGVPCVLGAGGSDAATVRIGWGERTPVLPPTSSSLLGQEAVRQDRGTERIRPPGCAGRTWRSSFCVTWVWFYCSVGWLLGFDFLLLLSFPRPFPFIFPPAIRNLFFFFSAAGHLVSHMDGVILEESPRESLLKPPFVLEVEKSIVVHEKDLDKIRTVSIQDCLISP